MKEKQKDESIEEQNKKLKLAGKILMTLILILIIVLAFNMVEVRKMKDITSGKYITIEDCERNEKRKYEMETLFEIKIDGDEK